MPVSSPSELSIDEKIGQLFFIGIGGTEVDDATASLLAEVKPGGVCLFTRNIRTAVQTRRLNDDLTQSLSVAPLISIDQEGGLVDRLRRVVTPMPAAEKIGTPDEARELGSLAGEAIGLLGFNMDFAPVVDVVDEVRTLSNNGMYSRAFGRSAEEVSNLAEAFLEGLEAQGILGCLKHFPGLGASRVDTHEELPEVSIDFETLESVDLLPYRELLRRFESLSVMIGHAAYPTADLQETGPNGKLLPASLSRNFVIKLLRQSLNFGGLTITDDLEMGAILKNFTIGEACVAAVEAGVDMLAICAKPEAITAGHQAVREALAAGRISEARIDESVQRIFSLKKHLSTPQPFDEDRLMQISEDVKNLNSRLEK